MSERCDLLLDYFNNQLTETETNQFEQHLKACTTCQGELEELHALTQDLPYSSEPIDPPAGMKDRVLSNILNDTNETTETTGTDETDSHETSVYQPQTPRKKKRRWYQPVMAAVLALSLIGNVAGLIYFTGEDNETTEPSNEPSLDTVENQISLESSEGFDARATATMVENDNDTNLIIQAEDLPELEGSETYQVWVLDDDKPSRAGTFVSNSNGEGAVSYALPSDSVKKWDTIAITKEPDANSQTPQGDILLSSPL